MWESVANAFYGISQQFEGTMFTMYLDTHKPPLVTTGVGNLIDPESEALKLPFRFGDRAATPEEISKEWQYIKSRVDLAQRSSVVWSPVCTLHLLESDVRKLVATKLVDYETALLKRPQLLAFRLYPADAQLALLLMAWAMGAGFSFPKCLDACLQRNFALAAAQSHMADGANPGLVPRNRAVFRCFSNAAQVLKDPLKSREVLHYPEVL